MRYVKRTVSTARRGPDFKAFEVEVGQFDSMEEATQQVGGNENLLKAINSAQATGAINKGRAICANAEEEETDDVVREKARTGTRSYILTGEERGPGAKKQLESARSLAARIRAGEEVSSEELAAFAASFGA